jgi:capsular exopolysaccharide synthesis family protein
VLAIFAVTVGAALVYLATADRVYEAQADVLVIPIPADDTLLRTLGLIPESSDPELVVETTSQLIDTPNVAERAAEELGGSKTPEAILEAVNVEPVPESNIVAVVGEGPTGEEARDLANAFAAAAIDVRTLELHQRIEGLLNRLREQLATLVDPGSATVLVSEIARLEALESEPDPTIRFETPAAVPENPVSPRPVLTIALAAVAGLLLGVGAAVALRTLDPVLRREDQLRAQYRIPVLTRVPREPGVKNAPLGPERLSLPAREAYLTLRATLTASAPGEKPPRSLLVTGASPSEGKTTTAINLAAALSLAGKDVILIDGDLRRPTVGSTLGVKGNGGLVSVLLENKGLEEALLPVPAYGPGLRVLLTDDVGPAMVELFSIPSATWLIDEAEQHADFVIIDSPPLTEVIDALPFARRVDKVLVVVRLGTSRLGRIKELGELLAANGIQPAGFALLGVSRSTRDGYYYAGAEAKAEAALGVELPPRKPGRERDQAAEARAPGSDGIDAERREGPEDSKDGSAEPEPAPEARPASGGQ